MDWAAGHVNVGVVRSVVPGEGRSFGEQLAGVAGGMPGAGMSLIRSQLGIGGGHAMDALDFVLLAGDIAIGMVAGGGGPKPRGEYLVRFGKGPESVAELAADAAKAEVKYGHGVSTKLQSRASAGAKHRVAPRAEVEKHFDVRQTGDNLSHYTVFLPKPITDTVAAVFNQLFTPKE